MDKHLHWAGTTNGVVLVFVRFNQHSQKLSKLSFLRTEPILFLKFQQRGNIPLVLRIRCNHFWRGNSIQHVFLNHIRNYRPLRHTLSSSISSLRSLLISPLHLRLTSRSSSPNVAAHPLDTCPNCEPSGIQWARTRVQPRYGTGPRTDPLAESSAPRFLCR